MPGIEIHTVVCEARDPMEAFKRIACCLFASALLLGASVSGRAQSSTTSSTSAVKKTAAKKRRHHRRHYEPKQKAPTPDRISEIQTALARDGYYNSDPNGKWDSATVAAMEKFQADHGLDSTGKIDALTLQKLGLGSDIAGVDAPRPPMPASGVARPAQTPATTKPDQPKPGAAGSTPAPGTPQPAGTASRSGPSA
jgi:peptidoglycan hydrolase-like protein with peptidoglycan-binding domain